MPWTQYWWLSACHKLGKAPNSGFVFFFSFLCGGSVSRGEERILKGLWWLPSPVLEFYWLRTSCFLIGKRTILDQRKAAEVAFMLGWQLAIAYTWRKEAGLQGTQPCSPGWTPGHIPGALSPTLHLGVAFRVWAIVLITVSTGGKLLPWCRIETNRILSESNTKSCDFYLPMRLKTF